MTDLLHVDETAATSLRGVCKCYGAVRVVDSVDLDAGYSELFGLIGHNGAGKSTLFKVMLGSILAAAGSIRVVGASVRGVAFRAARRQTGYLPENLVLHDNLSGLETLRFSARLEGASAVDCASLPVRVGLAGAVDQPVRAHSKGMRQRFRFVQALLGAPRVFFLDEPTNGFGPATIYDFYATLQVLCEQGVTILITSHILAELQQCIDCLAILADGRVLAFGSVAALRTQAGLPLTLASRVEADARGALWAQLTPLRAHGVEIVDGQAEHEMMLRCSRSLKMDALQALQPLGGRLLDLQTHELPFEDVFFSLRQTEAA